MQALADWLEAHVIFAASETEDLLLSSISSTSQADAAVAEGLPTSSERGAVAAAPESRRGGEGKGRTGLLLESSSSRLSTGYCLVQMDAAHS